MSLFQKSVLSKYLRAIDEAALTTQWQVFKQHFHNPTIQQNIRQSKEEQYQEGFLDDLFVKVLGYTKNPEPNFNLTTELKNISNAKKTDGAIIIDEKTIAVIELKGTNTTDLSKVETQAFQYKNNQPDAVYVITSNFEKLRFYIDNAVDFLEFNLFQLNQADFKLMWLCLAHKNLSKGIAKQVKDESLFNEENITKKLYKDYSTFKNELFASIQTDNPKYDKLTLYKKTQKLLDRFLFIFFAEDRLLLPPNSISAILKQWEQLKDLDEYKPLYSRYKKYFGYMNKGYKGKQHDIFAYNGGLFAADDILDNIKIDDEVLATHTQNLSNYDFESEVSVNILGHIFEHSLNEIEAITAELEGKAIDVKKTKRKKDGVFYTPKYITKYIVENTVGKLCIEKKTDLNINEADYAKERKGRKKETLKKLQQQLESYRNWLLSLTICDPACGSGAFLNQALEFLITEHRYIDELQAKLLNEPMVFSDIENAILENNLFGVDINEESVDIAKLSLWLRTAQKGRKLTTLSSNIKCGNSLIDDPAVAGAKAFNWQTEFPQVFENGGFDVVIGNPPYGGFLTKLEKDFFKTQYTITEYNFDTYNFFFELSINILKDNCFLGFITPNTFLVVENGQLLRKFLFEKNQLIELYETFNVFADAVVEPISAIIRKKPSNKKDSFVVLLEDRKKNNLIERKFSHYDILVKNKLIFNYRESNAEGKLYQKIKVKTNPLVTVAKVTTGIKPYQTGKGNPKQTKEIVIEKPFTSFRYQEGWYPLIRGTQINRYSINWNSEYIKYGNWLAEPRNPNIFFNSKLFIRRTDDKLLCSYDDQNFVGINSIHCIQSQKKEISNKYLLSLINSKVICWYFRHENFHMVGKPLAEVKVVFVERLPIIKIDIDAQSIFIDKVDTLINQNSNLYKAKTDFIEYLQAKHNLPKISKKLNNWYLLEDKDFFQELKKAKIKLEGIEEFNSLKVFKSEKEKALDIKSVIDQTDTEIDQMVYQLYGLTDEEIKIVEESV